MLPAARPTNPSATQQPPPSQSERVLESRIPTPRQSYSPQESQQHHAIATLLPQVDRIGRRAGPGGLGPCASSSPAVSASAVNNDAVSRLTWSESGVGTVTPVENQDLSEGQRMMQGPASNGGWQTLIFLAPFKALRYERISPTGELDFKMQVLSVSEQRWQEIAASTSDASWQAAVDLLLEEAIRAENIQGRKPSAPAPAPPPRARARSSGEFSVLVGTPSVNETRNAGNPTFGATKVAELAPKRNGPWK